jgi:hypothetical protein
MIARTVHETYQQAPAGKGAGKSSEIIELMPQAIRLAER